MPSLRAAAPKTISQRRWLLAGVAIVVAAAVFWGWSWGQGLQEVAGARRALERGDAARALGVLQAAAAVRPDRAETQYLLAVACRRTGRIDLFQRHLNRARELGWATDDLNRQDWLATAQAGDVDAVQSRLLETIEQGASDDAAEEIYEAIALGHIAANRFRDAWTCLDMWLQWRPDAPQARLLRASLFEAMADIPAATEDYRVAVTQLPENVVARVQLGRVLAAQGRRDEAEEQFRACLELRPRDFSSLLGVAQCARERKDLAESRRLLNVAMAEDLTPTQRAEALAEMGRALLDEGKAAESIEALTQAAALAPAEVSIHNQLALALSRAGQRDRARDHAIRAKDLRTQQERLIDIRRELAQKPDNADLRYEAGMILLRQGFGADALVWLQGALRCDPGHRKTHQFLAAYYAEVGNQERAAHHRLLAATGGK